MSFEKLLGKKKTKKKRENPWEEYNQTPAVPIAYDITGDPITDIRNPLGNLEAKEQQLNQIPTADYWVRREQKLAEEVAYEQTKQAWANQVLFGTTQATIAAAQTPAYIRGYTTNYITFDELTVNPVNHVLAGQAGAITTERLTNWNTYRNIFDDNKIVVKKTSKKRRHLPEWF